MSLFCIDITNIPKLLDLYISVHELLSGVKQLESEGKKEHMCYIAYYGGPGLLCGRAIQTLYGCDGCKAGPHRIEPGALEGAN